VAPLLSGSALTSDDVEVPEGHYTDASMAITVVANRNAIMLSIAVGAAVSRGAEAVAAAVHAGDHTVYPDCRPEFIEAIQHEARVANEGFIVDGFEVRAPFLLVGKDEIVRQGAALGVPFEETWSCYVGGELHCGRCGTCVERIEAFALAGVTDPTAYAEVSV
jgi:7-cyano-7-deazaguanine synthase